MSAVSVSCGVPFAVMTLSYWDGANGYTPSNHHNDHHPLHDTHRAQQARAAVPRACHNQNQLTKVATSSLVDLDMVSELLHFVSVLLPVLVVCSFLLIP